MARWRARPGRSLGSRDRVDNRQLPDDIRGIRATVLPARHWSNTPPDTPVWVVEIKGVSQYLGSDSEPWQYVMNVLHVESGSSMEGTRYLEPRLAPTVRDGS